MAANFKTTTFICRTDCAFYKTLFCPKLSNDISFLEQFFPYGRVFSSGIWLYGCQVSMNSFYGFDMVAMKGLWRSTIFMVLKYGLIKKSR